MPDVAFKDLCMDATDDGDMPERVARFWSAVLAQAMSAVDGGGFRLDPADAMPSGRRVWIDPVPEAPVGKTRVHLDLHVAGGDPAPLVALGARVVRPRTDDQAWDVLEGPDGMALCVMSPHPMAPDETGPFELVVDSADPWAQAQWWAARTGGTAQRRPGGGWAWVEGAAGLPFRFWVFNPVPEPKTAKNRVHWDVTFVDGDLDGLVAAGATVLRARDDEIRWTVLADPEGNEFCAFDAT